MRGIGKDSTKLFDEVHAWVNYEQLLAKCYIGPLINTATINLENPISSSSKIKPTNGFFKTPAQVLPFLQHSPLSSTNTSPARKPNAISDQPSSSIARSADDTTVPTPEVIPRFDWMQKKSQVIVIFYTKSLCNPGVSVEMVSEAEVIVRIFIERSLHVCIFKFAHAVQWPCTIRMNYETGKLAKKILSVRRILMKFCYR